MVNQWFGPSDTLHYDVLARVPVPVGDLCLLCQQSIDATDTGLMLGHYDVDPNGKWRDGLRPAHRQCLLNALGVRDSESTHRTDH